MEKRIKNKSGDILIRQTNDCGIVEIMHLCNNNISGCVIGYWKKRKCDGINIAEFISVNGRIMEIEYDNANILLEALKFGQKMADLLIEAEV